jgi:hypothetical protein
MFHEPHACRITPSANPTYVSLEEWNRMSQSESTLSAVIPAKAGIQSFKKRREAPSNSKRQRRGLM